MTNIAPDHLGLKDIMTLEDLARVKSVVVESVRPGGYAILNADDDQLPTSGHETMAVDFFPRNDLPPLSLGRVIEADIQSAFSFRENPDTPTFFD